MKKLLLALVCTVPLALAQAQAHGAVLDTPEYSFSNEGQRILIKRALKSFVGDLTVGTPCMISFDHLNEMDVVQFDRNVETRMYVTKQNKQVYSNFYDLTRENFVGQMIQIQQVLSHNCTSDKPKGK